jgi:hypothetical protein
LGEVKINVWEKLDPTPHLAASGANFSSIVMFGKI